MLGSDKPKVLLFSVQWPEYMIELANSLAATEQVEVGMALPSNHRLEGAHKQLISDRVEFFTYHVIFHQSIRDNLRMTRAIRRIVQQFRPSIIHVQSGGHKWFPILYFSLFRFPKIVNTVHDPYPHPGDQLTLKTKENWSKWGSMIYTSRYIVHGHKLKSDLLKHYRIKSEGKVDVIPHGHFGIYKKFQKEVVSEEPNTVLFFGRIWKYKGLEYLIEAANILLGRGLRYKYIIAGVGEDLEKYTEIIKDPTTFEIHNYRIPIDQAGIFFQRCSAVVLPYIDASQSGVVPLAFAYGKPVIATTVGSLPEVVIHNGNGLLVPPRDSLALADAIEKVFEYDEIRASMSKAAVKTANTEISWDAIAQKTLSTYKKALGTVASSKPSGQ